MLETGVWHLVNHADGLRLLREGLEERRHADHGVGHSSGAFTQQDRDNISLLLDDMYPWLEALRLHSSMDRIVRIRETFDEGHEEYSLSDILITQLGVLTETLQDELKRHVFMYLDPEEVALYKDPYRFFRKTAQAFPSTGYDIIDACRCLALGQGTACVFHCMGILQYGLHSLANHLVITFKTSIELENWQNIIDPIEKRVKELQEVSKSSKKDADLKFYSEAAAQFRYFKDAWRNHVCHSRERYDIHQAKSILLHVGDFMESISARLHEAK